MSSNNKSLNQFDIDDILICIRNGILQARTEEDLRIRISNCIEEKILKPLNIPFEGRYEYTLPSGKKIYLLCGNVIIEFKDPDKFSSESDIEKAKSQVIDYIKEKTISEKIVNDDLIELTIILPKKLFYNTQSVSRIIIFNKEKQEDRKRKILFIDATDLYVKHPEVRKLNKLSDEHIQKIVETYREFKTIPGFSRVVYIEEIIKNDYNLRVSKYVTKIQNNNSINIEEIKGLWKNIEEIKKEREEKEKESEEIIKIIVNKND